MIQETDSEFVGRRLKLLSENVRIRNREYNFDYQEQAARTVIAISSEKWTDEDMENIVVLSQLLGETTWNNFGLLIDSNPRLPRMLFVQKVEPNGNLSSVPIEELKTIIKACLQKL
jgi:hypothetical protein